MFTQLDNNGQKFVVAYTNRSNNKMEAKYSSYEGVQMPCNFLGYVTILMLSL